ncbi:hypothetical protein M378DRAFT_6242 [Amanita muscaria Koide BX008]|uniref:Uncharacterized protein n=1 Tax=Amanita muscaria (strain Koide BX008) TaxID=946122 RepID=A0A0C2T6C9_AMAMK|nr:hypothetical protein M378DRAFT_6242 [Amanita muscaria Koide BX008]
MPIPTGVVLGGGETALYAEYKNSTRVDGEEGGGNAGTRVDGEEGGGNAGTRGKWVVAKMFHEEAGMRGHEGSGW